MPASYCSHLKVGKDEGKVPKRNIDSLLLHKLEVISMSFVSVSRSLATTEARTDFLKAKLREVESGQSPDVAHHVSFL